MVVPDPFCWAFISHNHVIEPSSLCSRRKQSAGLSTRCGNCRKDLGTDTVVKMNNNVRFHKQCFQCVACHTTLDSGYTVLDGQVYCSACCQARLDSQIRKQTEEKVKLAKEGVQPKILAAQRELEASRKQRQQELEDSLSAPYSPKQICESCDGGPTVVPVMPFSHPSLHTVRTVLWFVIMSGQQISERRNRFRWECISSTLLASSARNVPKSWTMCEFPPLSSVSMQQQHQQN